MLRSPLLEPFAWLEHGFGERTDTFDQSLGASLKQIHSHICFTAEKTGVAGEGDALITAKPGLAVSVRTADCYPILLADPVRRAVAAIHAGWRGTAAHIVIEAMERMRSEYGTLVQDIVAAIGPGIGGCCYEVGEEVARQFGVTGCGRIDLATANRQLLVSAGVPVAQIHTAGYCTFCDAARFWSWRREKEQAGRMVSFVRVKAV
jgi:polyphenol oxidase